ncbi:MAG TPA: helix-turn-helix domain-containing protein [Terriglobales bacterium]|nr:helix-turn-helix domain-containing protein [Terriglobales bacterium]
MQYEWPGNVRELENCIERAVALGSQNVIDVHDLPPAIRRLSEPTEPELEPAPLNSTDLEELERETILRVFEQTKGDKALTGRMLGISRATLYRKLKRYNIGSVGKAAVAVTSQN